MKWFKHDSDASIDAKLQELLLDYGAAGYGLYWYCLELIAQGVGKNNITFELEHDVRIIARNMNLTQQETKDMMKKMIELELFSLSKNSKLACYAMAKRLDKSMTSNSDMRNIIGNIKLEGHDAVMISHDYLEESHDSVMMESDLVMQEEKRREEIRIKEEEKLKHVAKTRAFVPPTIGEVNAYATERSRQDLAKTFFDYYEAGNWKDSNGNQVKGWKQKFITWENRNPITAQQKKATQATAGLPAGMIVRDGYLIDQGMKVRGAINYLASIGIDAAAVGVTR